MASNNLAMPEGMVDSSIPKKIRKNVSVEPAVFFFGFAFGLVIYANTNLSMTRTCLMARKSNETNFRLF